MLPFKQNCCQTIKGRYEFWNPNRLGYKFFAEARGLWDIEKHNNGSITAVQAALLMNVTYNLYAMDKIGIAFGAEAVKLAQRLQLFAATADMVGTSERERHGYSYTAWCLYSWIT